MQQGHKGTPALIAVPKVPKGAVPERIEFLYSPRFHCKFLISALEVVGVNLLKNVGKPDGQQNDS